MPRDATHSAMSQYERDRHSDTMQQLTLYKWRESQA